MARPLRVGLTGGIASGKSRVMARLAAAGFGVIDLDRLAHELMEPGRPVFDDVVAAFGRGVLDPAGRIDRRALGAVVFRDPDARRRLDAIVHPRVREEEQRRAAALASAGVVVTEAALLVEAGMHLRFDRLVVVLCSPEAQLRRLREREGLDEGDARRRLAAQMPIVEKRRFAHLEVDTEGAPGDTDARADALVETLRELARERGEGRGEGMDRERAARGLAQGPRMGPRGLDPARFLAAISGSGGIEMEALRELLDPPAAPPWYRAARAGQGAPAPACLAGPVAAWSLLRAPGDPVLAASAMASVARLTHDDPRAIGNACLLVLAVSSAWSKAPFAVSDLLNASAGWRELARRFAGAEFEDLVSPALGSALTADEPGLRAAFERGFGEPSLAGLLLGAAGAADADRFGAWRQGLDRLAEAISGRERD
jgi:dephospho-CoA kinase